MVYCFEICLTLMPLIIYTIEMLHDDAPRYGHDMLNLNQFDEGSSGKLYSTVILQSFAFYFFIFFCKPYPILARFLAVLRIIAD